MLPPARGYASAHKWTMDVRAVAKIVNCVRIKLLEVAGNGLLHDQPAFAACFYLLQPAGLCSCAQQHLVGAKPAQVLQLWCDHLKKTSFILGKFSKLTGSSAEDCPSSG